MSWSVHLNSLSPPFWKLSELPSMWGGSEWKEKTEQSSGAAEAGEPGLKKQSLDSSWLPGLTLATCAEVEGGNWSHLQPCRQLLYRRKRTLSSRGSWWVGFKVLHSDGSRVWSSVGGSPALTGALRLVALSLLAKWHHWMGLARLARPLMCAVTAVQSQNGCSWLWCYSDICFQCG